MDKEFKKVFDQFSPMLDSWWPYVIGLIIGTLAAIRSYMHGPNCPSNDRIDGKIVVITGGACPVGREVALELARRGGHIILAVANVEAGNKLANEINAISGAKAQVRALDLSSLKSIRDFADKLEVNEIDILINNEGVYSESYDQSKDGVEAHFAINYLGHFLLTQLLLPKLKVSKQGRIINDSAGAHSAGTIHLDDLNMEKNFSPTEACRQSRLAMFLMTIYLSDILKDTNVTCNAVDPGLILRPRSSSIESCLNKTIIYPLMVLCFKTPVQAAQTSIYAAVANELDKTSGQYFSDCEIHKLGYKPSDTIVKQLYAKSLLLIQSVIGTVPWEVQPNLVPKIIEEES